MNTNTTLQLSFYGLGIEISSSDNQILKNIKRDYSFFADNTAAPSIIIEINATAPDYHKLPSLKANMYTPRNICYKGKNRYFIDYFGKGLTTIDHATNHYTIHCQEAHLRHEIAFLTILSLVGQHLDSRHMHRVHGLGVEINKKCVLILLPSGGGKTTLLLELFKKDNVKLISEDSPLINQKGDILPFPLRIGVPPANKPDYVPEEYIRHINRMEFASKFLIDIDFFKDKIRKEPVAPGIILCGARCLGEESKIVPMPKHAVFKEFVKNSIVGLGLYQGVEFLLQEGLFEAFKKSGVLLSRTISAIKVIARSKTYQFIIGSDKKKNAETILNFLS